MKRKEVNIKLNILIEFKIHDTILTHRTYKILNPRIDGIQSRALINGCKSMIYNHFYFMLSRFSILHRFDYQGGGKYLLNKLK